MSANDDPDMDDALVAALARAEAAERKAHDLQLDNDVIRGKFCDRRDRCDVAESEAAALRAQLPEGMEHCTIRFIECSVGHGRLTATNWVDHGCGTCERDALQASYHRVLVAEYDKREALDAEVAALRAENERLRTEALMAGGLIRGLVTERDAANALLERVRKIQPKALGGDVRAHLAGQPAALIVSRGCAHSDTIELYPSTTGGTERCLTCGAERTQHSKGGPWRPWRQPAAPVPCLGGLHTCKHCGTGFEQPAAPGLGCPCGWCIKRAEAEQRVLDACRDTEFTWEGHITEESNETAIGLAELARREGK